MQEPLPFGGGKKKDALARKQDCEDLNLRAQAQAERKSTTFYTNHLIFDSKLSPARMEEMQCHLSAGPLHFPSLCLCLTWYQGDTELLAWL